MEQESFGYALVALGGFILLLGALAERYHSARFIEHMDRLNRLAAEEQEEEISKEVVAFHEDQRVTIAVRILSWSYPVGTSLLALGAFILVFE